uniref:cutinase family protein n=1 Tax=Gordonia sp. B7-2 TaxID=3420932 RepID=UPI003D8DB0CB
MSDRPVAAAGSPSSNFSVSHRSAVVLVALVSALAVVIAYCLPGVVGQARATECTSNGAVVIVGGTNDPDAKALVGVEQRYTSGWAGYTPHASKPYDVIYADYPTTLWPLGAAGYDDSVSQGRSSTKSAIASYSQACPGKPIVVAGYSQGARVAGDVLAEIGNSPSADQDGDIVEGGEYWLVDVNGTPDDLTDDVVIDKYVRDENGAIVYKDGEPVSSITGELYSDPRQAGNKEGRGIELSLVGVIPGLTMQGSRGTDDEDPGFGELNDNVTSVCVDGDPICDLPDPLYDPIGAIDGLLGYFTKHGLYPYQMYLDPNLGKDDSGEWTTGRTIVCEDNICRVSADSAFVELIQQGANAIGLSSITVPDFLKDRPTLDIPFGLELAHFGDLTRLVGGLLPPLPKLGYGAYLPSLFVVTDIIDGIVGLQPALIKRGVEEFAKSVVSIALYPVNVVRYWSGLDIVAPTPYIQPPNHTANTLQVTNAVNALYSLADTSGEPVDDEAADEGQQVTALRQTTPDESVVPPAGDDTGNPPNGDDEGAKKNDPVVPQSNQPVVNPTPGPEGNGEGDPGAPDPENQNPGTPGPGNQNAGNPGGQTPPAGEGGEPDGEAGADPDQNVTDNDGGDKKDGEKKDGEKKNDGNTPSGNGNAPSGGDDSDDS